MRRGRRLPLEQLQPYLLQVPPPSRDAALSKPADSAPLRWPDLFGNDHPVEIEIGFGKGLFLINAAQAHPQVNYLGVEIERKYVLFTATRLAKRGFTNVKLACCDARGFLSQCVATDSVHAIHVFFPDPWWKNRHRKRRLVTADFAAQCARALKRHGRLHLVSDVAEYFAETQEMLARISDLNALPMSELPAPEVADRYLTNFERKYRMEGRPIFRSLHAKK
ncbi:MAG: tRNA (guanosine(46)-N7)-methyltransferase TrmB [Planctomycetes bacterium]|nr:tRNA (guanosine(46)-N7)-methyltransferase TrmB [Planctomycetota bacterium]